MIMQDEAQNALTLIRQGRSDFEIERIAGISLVEIIGLRGWLAAARDDGQPPSERVRAPAERRPWRRGAGASSRG